MGVAAFCSSHFTKLSNLVNYGDGMIDRKRFVKLLTSVVVTCAVTVASCSIVLAVTDRFSPPSQKERCRVCGMFVSKYPAWIGSIYFTSGQPAFFDGPKDLFTYLLNLKKFAPGVMPSMVSAIKVKDYYSLAAIDARTAWYVIGSDVYGPMGHELVAFGKESDALEFMKDHRGKKVVRFGDVTSALLTTLE